MNESMKDNNEILEESQENTLESSNIEDNSLNLSSENDLLDKARKYGYKTKEELEAAGKSVKKLRTPEEFIEYGEKWDKEKALQNKIDKLEAQNREILEYHKQNAFNSARQARLEIEQQLNLAKEKGDVNAVEHFVNQRKEFESQQAQQAALRLQVEQVEANNKFSQRNAHWFNDSNPELKQKAMAYAKEIMTLYPQLSLSEASDKVENRMKFEHPEIVIQNSSYQRTSSTNSNINKSTLEGNGTGVAVDNNQAFRRLTPQQQAEYKATLKFLSPKTAATYTVQDYLTAVNNANNPYEF